MPIELAEKQILKTPPVEIPETEYPLAWMEQSVIRWPHGSDGTAMAELVPLSADRTKVLRRNTDGSDASFTIRIDSMLTAMARCPELAAAMPPYIAGLNAYNKILVADAKIAAEEAAARDAAEAERMAAIEAARIAAEEAAARIAEYNTPQAKAARVAAAKAEFDRLTAEAAAMNEEAEAMKTAELEAMIAQQNALEEMTSKSAQAMHLSIRAQWAAAELARLEAE